MVKKKLVKATLNQVFLNKNKTVFYDNKLTKLKVGERAQLLESYKQKKSPSLFDI